MKNYLVSDIKKIIKESVNEITRMSAGGAQSITPSNITTNNKKPSKSVLNIKPTCNTAFYSEPDADKNEFLTVRLLNIHNPHKSKLQTLWGKYKDIFFAKPNQTMAMKGAPTPFDLIVNPGKEDDFVNLLPSLIQDIADMSGVGGLTYDENSLKSLQLSILGRIDEAPNEEDLRLANERQATNIKDIIQKLSDPDFIKKIGFVGGVNVSSYSNINDIIKQGNAMGWRISPLNQLMVLSYLPNATFVTNAWTWEHVFNREIIDTKKFAFELKPSNNKPVDINARMKAAAALGYIDKSNPNKNPYDVYKQLKKTLSQSQKIAFEFLTNIYNPHEAFFDKQKVYDISNTRLIPGAYDVWNEEINFSDNIRGFLNKKATEYINQQNNNDTQIETPIETPTTTQWQSKSDEELGNIITILKNICLDRCGSVPRAVDGDSIGDTIAHYTAFYAKNYICTHRNIVKPNEIQVVSNLFAIAMAAVFSVPIDNRVNNLSTTLNDSKFEEKLTDLWQDFIELVSLINVELLKISSKKIKNVKASKGNQTNNANTANAPLKNVMESIGNKQLMKPIQFKDFVEIYKSITNNEDDINNNTLLETMRDSFFNFLDRLDNVKL